MEAIARLLAIGRSLNEDFTTLVHAVAAFDDRPRQDIDMSVSSVRCRREALVADGCCFSIG
jgi:hypothetical protein